jgi:phytoene dehydrogenase-like protein
VRYNHPVRTLSDMAPARVVLADTAPGALGAIATDRLGAAFRRRADRFTHGPGVFKIDYALDEPVPWTNELSHRAGTLHLGGTVAELAASERDLTGNNTRQPPFVLVAQPSVCDDSRAPVGKHTLWVYCHVPPGSTEDMTSAVEAQIERFAPGFGDVVRARHTMNTAAFAAYNANYVGGDIAGGSMRGRQVLMRGVGLRPYRTGVDSVLLCSASTPPGAGIHGMCGLHAANTALAGVLR